MAPVMSSIRTRSISTACFRASQQCRAGRHAAALSAVQRPAAPALLRDNAARAFSPEAPEATQGDPTNPDDMTVFVGNLPWQVTEEELRESFAEAGDAIGVRIAEDRDGRRRGFAFVEFGTLEEAQAALRCDGKDLGGRAMRVDVTTRGSQTPRRPSFGGGRGGGGGRGNAEEGRSVFVKGFDRNLSEEDVRQGLTDAFSQFGEVVEVRLPVDFETGTLRGFGYVVYSEAAGQPAQAAESLTGQQYLGGSLFCDPNPAPRGGGGGRGGRGGGRGGGGFGGGYGGGGGGFGGGGDFDGGY